MAHFTYKSIEDTDKESLCQGDVLELTDELKCALSKIHPYFNNGNYPYFIVITQSCDLVKRDGKNCKSPYITLAAVRTLDDFYKKELKRNNDYLCVSKISLLSSKKENKYYQLTERLYNNTEPDYFFLFKDEEHSLNDSMVAYLKVSIALKSELHYESCLKAKILELTDEYKAKLGWLVGNIYSRVGTTDWTTICTDSERKARIKDELQSRFLIAEPKVLNKLKAELEENGEKYNTIEDAMSFVEELPIKSNYEEFMDCLMGEIDKFQGFVSNDEKEHFKRVMKNATIFKQYIKR